MHLKYLSIVPTLTGASDFPSRPIPEFIENIADKRARKLLSGDPELEKSGKVTKAIVKQRTGELRSLRDNPDSVLFFGFMKANATVL